MTLRFDQPCVRKSIECLQGNQSIVVGPTGGSFASIAANSMSTNQHVLFVTAHLDDADEIQIMLLGLGVDAVVFPALESDYSSDLIAARYAILERIHSSQVPQVIVASIASLMQMTPPITEIEHIVKRMHVGQEIPFAVLQAWLIDAGYERRNQIEDAAQFAVRGGVLDVATASGEFYRLDFDGNEIEAINEVDPISLGSDCQTSEIVLTSAKRLAFETTLPAYLSKDWDVLIDDIEEVASQGASYFERIIDTSEVAHLDDVRQEFSLATRRIVGFACPPTGGTDCEIEIEPLRLFSTSPMEALEELAELGHTHEIVITCQSKGECERLTEFSHENQPLHGLPSLAIEQGYVQRGFIVGKQLAIVPSHELFHRYELRRSVKVKSKSIRQVITEFDVGDIVVHRDFGIAEYVGLQQLEGQFEQDFISLRFAGNRIVHVPVTQGNLVQRYVGAFRGRPKLSALGGTAWSNQKEKAKGAVADLATEMLRVQALRETARGIAFPTDTEWMYEFESSFPYEETEDQKSAINAMKADMQSPRPMDRLICGDVGFGKTEVAIRGAFKAVEAGRQVAVLVPTTVLAVQHERTFKSRFAEFPFEIESLTRFQTKQEQKEILERSSKGEVDILIGTHRILSQDVSFQNLGLVVIDEEQRFGVEHKNRLLDFREEADVLTLTATPIPRTLHMALLGIRDISSLQTAPVNRRAIITEIKQWDRNLVKLGIQKELSREGQVFYVHNRVHDIDIVASEIREIVPEAKVIVGHGQMPPRELEKVMLTFVRGDADVLVSTTIIESGIDIPTANTMFIDDADMFGLSDLHQLRGRVGRYKHRAYCTLMLPKKRFVNPTARKRLHAIEQFSMLGAGFQIAIRDLEIRGAGNLLGSEQSGHIAAVGYEMYCQLLYQAVKALKDGVRTNQVEALIDVGVVGRISGAYIATEQRRLTMYRRLAEAKTLEDVSIVVSDMKTGYGECPSSVQTFIKFHQLRIVSTEMEIESFTIDETDVVIKTKNPSSLLHRLQSVQGSLRPIGLPSKRGIVTIYYRSKDSHSQSDWVHHLHEMLCL